MDVKPHPTSPQYRADTTPVVAKVWNDQQLVRPSRLPWVGLVILILVLNTIVTIGAIIGWGWFSRHAAHTRFLQWLPVLTSTTVVQTTNTAPTTTVPTAVKNTLTSLLGLAGDEGSSGVYLDSVITNFALPLSSTGWMVTWSDSLPSGTLVAIVPPSGSVPITQSVADPSSSAKFFKVDHLDQSPVTLDADPLTLGQTVWVAGGTLHQPTAVSRTIVSKTGPSWVSADQSQQFWQLDAPVTSRPGAPVMTADGQVAGIIGANNRVWPVDQINPIIGSVIQRGQIARPSFGFRFVMASETWPTSPAMTTGAIVGAETGDQPVTPGGPAAKAGLKNGDMITAVDQHDLQTDLSRLLTTYHPGDHLRLTVQRGQTTIQLTLTVGQLPT